MGGLIGGGKPDNSAAMESLRLQREQTATAKSQAEEERRKSAEDYSAKKRLLSRGGKRALLAEGRLTPETGIDDEDMLKPTLGA
jgi:hypothetical protein|tara:strand:+ start:132 stop:383 length:252 start_codon:yes stop_codon:yes gene_type:complete